MLSPGDYNGDGFDDIAVAVSVNASSFNLGNGSYLASNFKNAGVYIIFGKATGWNGTVSLLDDASVRIKGLGITAQVTNAGDVDQDGKSDLLISDAAGAYLFYGRANANWVNTQTVADVDFTSAGAASLEGVFTIDNTTPGSGGLWHVGAGRSSDGLSNHSPLHSLYYGQAETSTSGGNFNTGLRNGGSVTSTSLNLASFATATLTFNYFLKTEGVGNFDEARVEITVNGVTTLLAGNKAGGGGVTLMDQTVTPTGVWTTAAINLTPYVGNQVQIRFTFDTKDATANNFEGWFVDDVKIQGAGLNVNGGVRFTAPAGGNGSFLNVAGTGHFNAGNFNDFAVEYREGTTEKIFIFYGSASLLTGGNIDVKSSASLSYAAGQTSGFRLRGLGDVDNDSFSDLAFASPNDSFIVWGANLSGAGLMTTPALALHLANLPAQDLFIPLGDINKDGKADLGALALERAPALIEDGSLFPIKPALSSWAGLICAMPRDMLVPI